MRQAEEFELFESGVAWIGNVSNDCKLKKIKHITCKIGSGKTPKGGSGVYKKEGVLFLRSQNIFDCGLNLENAVYISEDFDNTQKNSRVYRGDILFNITGSSIGRACVFDMDCNANVNQHVCIIRSNEEIVYNKYLYYVLISDICKNYINACKEGVNRQGITFEQLGDFIIPLYSLDKQKVIADYLENMCKYIDESIDNQKQSLKKIEEYKEAFILKTLTKGIENTNDTMPSGVDFIGDIPHHWSINKIRYIADKIGSGKTPRGGEDVYSKRGVLFLRCQNILDGSIELKNKRFISEAIDENMKNSRVYCGDVLLNITGGSMGRSAVYKGEAYANVSQHVCIIRPLQQYVESEYLQYVLSSKIGQNSILETRAGTNRDSLNFEQIGNIKIPIPPIQEQIDIALFLQEKINRIDSVIDKKNSITFKLLEYKRSVVFELITGKTVI